MNLTIVNNEKNFLEVSFEGNAHTILNLIKSKLLDEKDVTFAGYNKPHPLLEKSSLIIRTKKEDPKKVLKKSIDEIIKELQSLSLK